VTKKVKSNKKLEAMIVLIKSQLNLNNQNNNNNQEIGCAGVLLKP
jgi:hypothetical protein